MTSDDLATLNKRRLAALDRYRGAFLGLALADAAAARSVFDGCDTLLDHGNLLDLRWPDPVLFGGVATLWHGGDLHATDSALASLPDGAPARRAAVVMSLLLAGVPRETVPDDASSSAVAAVRRATCFADGLRRLQSPASLAYGLLAGAAFGEGALDAEAVRRLPDRARARAIAGALFERVWTPAPPDAPEVVCEHCRALLERR
ncbi:MAG: hypothetical protein KatS3mg060_0024 [Dehalococcoidia bacterium]|jgi:hypothetical protein|nr:MAG: hypothetical protein KatS3mg060_0024 [Dehalococcoidia bacterium]